jgi:hypothetical protein
MMFCGTLCSMETSLGNTVKVTGVIQTETFTERETVLTQGHKCPLSAFEYFGLSRGNRIPTTTTTTIIIIIIIIIIIT